MNKHSWKEESGQFYPRFSPKEHQFAIQILIFLEGKLPAAALQPERIFPDGCMELIIHYGDGFQKLTNDKLEKQHIGFVFGQLEEYIELVPSCLTGVMGVKFFPDGLSHFTDLAVSVLKHQAVELRHIFKKRQPSTDQRYQ